MKSMTGYGVSKLSRSGIELQVEIKSVNSRFLDQKIYLSRELGFYEYQLRKLISSSLKRGSVEVRVTYSDNREPKLRLNSSKLIKYHSLIQSAMDLLKIPGTIGIEHLVNEPGVIESSNNYDEDDEFRILLNEAVEAAVMNHEKTVIAEGQDMKNTLRQSMQLVSEALAEIDGSLDVYKKDLFSNMHSRIRDIIADYKIDTLEQRLVQEMAIYIDRSDVQEEITRLRSHIDTFLQVLEDDDEEIGKKLNFITQEMQREANTLGSKYSTSKSFKHILIIKEEIEKDREIVQNVA